MVGSYLLILVLIWRMYRRFRVRGESTSLLSRIETRTMEQMHSEEYLIYSLTGKDSDLLRVPSLRLLPSRRRGGR